VEKKRLREEKMVQEEQELKDNLEKWREFFLQYANFHAMTESNMFMEDHISKCPKDRNVDDFLEDEMPMEKIHEFYFNKVHEKNERVV